MGYRVKRREALITFEGTDYDGAEIRCSLDVSMSTFFQFQKLAGGEQAEIEEAFSRFGSDVLISWNLEDDAGGQMSADATGFLSLPPSLASTILTKWMEAVADVPTPLGSPHPDSST